VVSRRYLPIAVALAAVVAASAPACRTASRTPDSAARCPGDGMLIVRNYSGRVLEVYESGLGGTAFIGFASPGVTRMRVRGANDLGAIYRVREPAEGRDAATVTWIRRSAVAQGARLALELACA
jgi:hypothetical protein